MDCLSNLHETRLLVRRRVTKDPLTFFLTKGIFLNHPLVQGLGELSQHNDGKRRGKKKSCRMADFQRQGWETFQVFKSPD